MLYQKHPSQALNDLFNSKPYQGVHPMDATFLFVGLDANYGQDIENSPVFQNVLEYHQNGADFWKRHGVHHPFLLAGYKGDGRRYHHNFARIGFRPEHAEEVSFVELLHVPTVGRNALSPADFSANHLSSVRNAILQGNAKHVFVSAGVMRLMGRSGKFPTLVPSAPGLERLKTVYKDAGRTVYQHLHFSNYGKFEKQMRSEAEAIASLISGVAV